MSLEPAFRSGTSYEKGTNQKDTHMYLVFHLSYRNPLLSTILER